MLIKSSVRVDKLLLICGQNFLQLAMTGPGQKKHTKLSDTRTTPTWTTTLITRATGLDLQSLSCSYELLCTQVQLQK